MTNSKTERVEFNLDSTPLVQWDLLPIVKWGDNEDKIPERHRKLWHRFILDSTDESCFCKGHVFGAGTLQGDILMKFTVIHCLILPAAYRIYFEFSFPKDPTVETVHGKFVLQMLDFESTPPQQIIVQEAINEAVDDITNIQASEIIRKVMAKITGSSDGKSNLH